MVFIRDETAYCVTASLWTLEVSKMTNDCSIRVFTATGHRSHPCSPTHLALMQCLPLCPYNWMSLDFPRKPTLIWVIWEICLKFAKDLGWCSWIGIRSLVRLNTIIISAFGRIEGRIWKRAADNKLLQARDGNYSLRGSVADVRH